MLYLECFLPGAYKFIEEIVSSSPMANSHFDLSVLVAEVKTQALYQSMTKLRAFCIIQLVSAYWQTHPTLSPHS